MITALGKKMLKTLTGHTRAAKLLRWEQRNAEAQVWLSKTLASLPAQIQDPASLHTTIELVPCEPPETFNMRVALLEAALGISLAGIPRCKNVYADQGNPGESLQLTGEELRRRLFNAS